MNAQEKETWEASRESGAYPSFLDNEELSSTVM